VNIKTGKEMELGHCILKRTPSQPLVCLGFRVFDISIGVFGTAVAF
jgi:hypothetical protein